MLRGPAEPGELQWCLPPSLLWFCDPELPRSLAYRFLPWGRASSAPWRNAGTEAPRLLEQGPAVPGSKRGAGAAAAAGQEQPSAARSRGQLEQPQSPEELKLHPRLCSSAGLERGCEHLRN